MEDANKQNEQTNNSDKEQLQNEVNPNLAFTNRIDLSELQEGIEAIRIELHKVIIGQKGMIDLLIATILSSGHSLIEGVPGVAKTITAKLIAKTMKVDFSRIQFTPDIMPSDILGTSIFNMKTSEFEFKSGPIFSNIVLIDEINRAPAKTQAALFEVMEEKQVTIDGKTYKMEAPFLVFATQNPIEQEGTYRLPEAQLDRFLFKIEVEYPTLEEEIEIIETHHNRKETNKTDVVKGILTASQVAKFQKQVQEILIEKHLINYIAKIVTNTRENPFLYLGASPRASLAILQASKAFAAMQGRDFVTPDDIKRSAIPVLQHRVIVTPEREMEGVTSKQVINQMLETIEIPR
ncbi:MAG TPA: MoxR family ATPase [Flavobacteriaceae bacterium]|nr:MoxR family ATPase [Flavobacteriaceae bacterium]HIP27399.1 MoxR family ATPase [Flavobacteriaceae bacterium]